MGAVLWVHRDFYIWAIGVLTEVPKTNWSFWHLSLCSCVTHPEGLHWWEVSWCSPDWESGPEVTGVLRRGMQPSFNLLMQERRRIHPTVLRTLQWVVEIYSSLCLYHQLWMWCWGHHTPPTFQQWPWTILYLQTTVVAKINGQHCWFLAAICLWINSPVSKISVIMVWFCRGDWKTKVVLSLGMAWWW